MWLCIDILANEFVSSVIKKMLSPAAQGGRGLCLLLYLCNKAVSEWYLCGPIILTKFFLLFTLSMGALKHC